MATLRQTAQSSGSGLTGSVAFTQTCLANSLVVLSLVQRGGGNTGSFTINDGSNNIQYTRSFTGIDGTDQTIIGFAVVTSAAKTITITFTQSQVWEATIAEFTGLATNVNLINDQLDTATVSGSPLSITNAGSTSQAVELVIAVVGGGQTSDTFTTPTGYTQVGTTNGGEAMYYLVTSATGVQSVSIPRSSTLYGMGGLLATFKSSNANTYSLTKTETLPLASDSSTLRVIGRGLSDAVALGSDVVRRTIKRTSTDAVVLANDTVRRLVSRTASDTLSLRGDSLSRRVGRTPADAVALVSDIATKSLPRTVSDTIAIGADLITSRGFGRWLAESLSPLAPTATSSPYDIYDGVKGTFADGCLLYAQAPRAFTWSGGTARVDVAPSGTFALTIYKNGVSAGAITIPSGTTTGTLSNSVTFNPGDLIDMEITGSAGASGLIYYLQGSSSVTNEVVSLTQTVSRAPIIESIAILADSAHKTIKLIATELIALVSDLIKPSGRQLLVTDSLILGSQVLRLTTARKVSDALPALAEHVVRRIATLATDSIALLADGANRVYAFIVSILDILPPVLAGPQQKTRTPVDDLTGLWNDMILSLSHGVTRAINEFLPLPDDELPNHQSDYSRSVYDE